MTLNSINLLLKKLGWKPVEKTSKGKLIKFQLDSRNNPPILYVPIDTEDKEYKNYIENLLNIISELYDTHSEIIKYTLEFINESWEPSEILNRFKLPILLLNKNSNKFGNNYILLILNKDETSIGPIEFYVMSIIPNQNTFFAAKNLSIENEVFDFVDKGKNFYYFDKAIEMAKGALSYIIMKEATPSIPDYYFEKDYLDFLNLEPINMLDLQDIFKSNPLFKQIILRNTKSESVKDFISKL